MRALNQAGWPGLLIVLVLAPFGLDGYWLSLLTLIFYFAYVGQAWNLMMGYAGLLSLGHALFFGMGGYLTAILAERYGLIPWIGIPLGGVLAAILGGAIAWLGFRFAVRGIYFALLTIAFAEFFRILFDNWSFVGGSGGYFLSSVDAETRPLIDLRGSGELYYYGFLALAAGAYLGCRALIGSRLGFYWRAIREDEDAARALGVKVLPMKILVVAISAGMTGIGGGLFALLNGSLFPDTMMSMRMSIEMIIAPIIGGLGTLGGPIVGAFIVVPVMEIANDIGQGAGIFGFNTFVYGVLVFLIIVFMPGGFWPWITKRFARRQRDRENPDA